MIQNSLRLINKQVKHSVEIRLNLARDIPIFQGRNIKIQEVLVNIIINALQAQDKPEGLIEISTHFLKEKGSVQINICDNGKGMDERITKYIFDPFYTTKRNSGGIGLGLSIAYRSIEEHKGMITVDSTPGIGTRFCIHIPVDY